MKNMSARNKKKAAELYQKLEQLRSATDSTSVNKESIVADALRYIQELKGRVETLNQDVASLQSSSQQGPLSAEEVKVETLEQGFLIDVHLGKNCPGLLVSVLEAFEELGLQLIDARVSCAHVFELQAVSQNEGQHDRIDAEVIKQAVSQAIGNWNDEEQDD